MPSLRWPAKSQRVIALDVEITGTGVTGRIVQVGLAGNTLLEPTAQLIDPEVIGWSVDAFCDKRGVPCAERTEIKTFAEFAPDLHTILDGAVVVLHNGGNDLKHLDREFQAVGLEMPVAYRVIDTYSLARKLELRAPSYKLGELATLFNLREPLQTAHNAKTDSEWTLRLLITLMNRHPEFCADFYGDCFDVVSTHFTCPKWTTVAMMGRPLNAKRKRRNDGDPPVRPLKQRQPPPPPPPPSILPRAPSLVLVASRAQIRYEEACAAISEDDPAWLEAQALVTQWGGAKSQYLCDAEDLVAFFFKKPERLREVAWFFQNAWDTELLSHLGHVGADPLDLPGRRRVLGLTVPDDDDDDAAVLILDS